MHAALFCSFHPGPFDHTSQAMADQYERSRAEMNNPAVVAAQSMFFTGPGRAKRGPPTPEMSGLTTPLGTDETMGQQEQMPTNPQVPPTQPLVQPVILEDHTAAPSNCSRPWIQYQRPGPGSAVPHQAHPHRRRRPQHCQVLPQGGSTPGNVRDGGTVGVRYQDGPRPHL